MKTATEQQVLAVLTAYFSNTFVTDQGDDMPAYMASDVLELLQRECGL